MTRENDRCAVAVQVQTPQKELVPFVNRKHKPTNSAAAQLAKTHPKSLKKSLNPAFSTVLEDVVLESQRELADFDENQLTESLQSSIPFLNPEVSPSSTVPGSSPLSQNSSSSPSSCITYLDPEASPPSMASGLSPLSQMSSTITPPKAEALSLSANRLTFGQSSTGEKGYLEVELLLKSLRQSLVQVLNSADVEIQHKKLLEVLVKTAVDGLHGLHEERDRFVEVASRKTSVIFWSYFLWILAFAAVVYYRSSFQVSFEGPPPT